jgi:predicted phage terminase large subunit-like protein
VGAGVVRVVIQEAIRHFNDVLKNRGVGYRTRKLVSMQRVAPYDLTQDILETMDQGGESFETLILPDVFDPTFQITFPNGLELKPDKRDRRNPDGDYYEPNDPEVDPVLLFPQLYPEQVVRDLRSSNADRADAIYGQNPRRDKLGAFKEKDLRYFYVLADEQSGAERHGLDTDQGWVVYEGYEVWRVIGVDLAASLAESADFTCMEVWGVTPDKELLLLDMVHGRIEGPDQIETLWSLQSQWRAHVCLIENTAYQLSFVQSAVRAGLPAQAVKADRDKWTRSIPAQTLVRNHRVYLRAGAHFTQPMKEELTRFPGPGKKDMVDPFAHVARALAMGELAAPEPVDRPPHHRPTRKFGPFSGPRPDGAPFGRAPPFG